MSRYALDRHARRLAGGRVLMAGSPLTLFRLGPAGQRVVDAIEREQDVPASAGPLLERMVRVGAAHPRPAGGSLTAGDVTVVVPVFGHDPADTIAALGPVGAVVVVDDASDPPISPQPGVTGLRRHVNGGPAVARMAGAALAVTPLVAFVDADCLPAEGWLAPLLAHLDDDRVGLAAPRVVSTPGATGTLARYEAVRSPLDLGGVEGRIAPTTRISYVPAAAVLVRAEALRQAGGFDSGLRWGEDVDLVWRLVGAGWRARYEPRSVVVHRPRPSVALWMAQRFGYGSAAAPLDERHPGLAAPAIVGRWAAAGWLAAGAGHPAVGVLMGLAPAVGLARTLRGVPGREGEAVRLAALGMVRTGEQLASSATRVWWPVTALAAIGSRRFRRLLALAFVVPVITDWVRRPGGLDPVRYAVLRLLDDVAYGAGVWSGALRARRAGALLPSLAVSRRRGARAAPPPSAGRSR